MKCALSIYLLFLVVLISSCSDSVQTEKLLRFFIDRHVDRIKPVNTRMNEAAWATYSGKSSFSDLMNASQITDSLYKLADQSPEYYQQILNGMYSNQSDYDILSKINTSGLVSDPLLKRQLVKMLREYLSISNNWDKTEKKQSALFEKFYELLRAENAALDTVTLCNETQVRMGYIRRFAALNGEFKSMIKVLNADVAPMGYRNFFQFRMDNQDISMASLDKLVQILDEATRDDYLRLLKICKQQLDNEFCLEGKEISPLLYRYAHSKMILPDEWNVQFSRDEMVKKLTLFFDQGGFKIGDILSHSDIWYDKQKVNSSFFIDIDHERRDFRVFANAKTDVGSFINLIHEFGHAVHYANIGEDVPYLLKGPNTIVAEGVALYFDAKPYTSERIRLLLELPSLDQNPYFEEFKNPAKLVFIRKLIRNIQFEKLIFENPEQDFNELWWSLNKTYLFFEAQPHNRLPEWMSNQHIVLSSGYHAYYLFAMAIAAQLEAYFPDDRMAPLRENLMEYGDSKPWYQLIEQATGESLNIQYLINSYRKVPFPGRPISFRPVGTEENLSLIHLLS